MDQPGTALPLRFHPGQQQARILWAQQFAGKAVTLDDLAAGEPVSLAHQGGLASRRVRTTER